MLPDELVRAIVLHYTQASWLPPIPASYADTSPLLFFMRKHAGQYKKELSSCILRGHAERVMWILTHNAATCSPSDVVDAAADPGSALFWSHVPHPVPSVCLLQAVKTTNLEWTRTVARDVAPTDPVFSIALLHALRRRALHIASWIKAVMECEWPRVEVCMAAARWTDSAAKYSVVRWIYMNHPMCQINTIF